MVKARHGQIKTWSSQDMAKSRHGQVKTWPSQDMVKSIHHQVKTSSSHDLVKSRHGQVKTCSSQDMDKSRHGGLAVVLEPRRGLHYINRKIKRVESLSSVKYILHCSIHGALVSWLTVRLRTCPCSASDLGAPSS